MPLRPALAAVICATCCLAPTAAAGAAPAPSPPWQLPLSHAGRWITDARGRAVILHGINMVYKLAPYAADAVGFGEDDAAFLAAEGLRSVRLGVIYKAVEPRPGVYDDAYLGRIRATVDTLGRHGIVTTLDFHQDLYNERFQGEGWPDWAVMDDGLPAQPQTGFPGNYLAMPALQRAFDHFFDNDPGPGGVGLQDRYAAAWRHVAGRFGDDRNVLGYELLNEPWPGSTWQACAQPVGCPTFDAKLTAFTRRVADAIRQVDRRTLVIYEPNVLFNDGADTQLGPIGDPHAVFAFHDYCLPAGSSGSDQGCDTFDDLVFANAAKHVQATGDASLMTEFGATEAPDILDAMVRRADRNMVGWQEWHYCGCSDPTTSGPGATQAIVLDPSKPPEGANIKPAKLELLTRPYPLMVSGTPEAYGFDPATHSFSLRYSTTRPDGRGASFADGALSAVEIPARQYPHGYRVSVRGARVRSAAGAPILELASCAGAREIVLSVTAAGPAGAGCAGRPARPRRGHLRVTVRPRRVFAGRRRAFRVMVRRADGRPAPGIRVTIARHRGRTGPRGRVILRLRPARAGRLVVRARGRGASGRAVVRVLHRARRRGVLRRP